MDLDQAPSQTHCAAAALGQLGVDVVPYTQIRYAHKLQTEAMCRLKEAGVELYCSRSYDSLQSALFYTDALVSTAGVLPGSALCETPYLLYSGTCVCMCVCVYICNACL